MIASFDTKDFLTEFAKHKKLFCKPRCMTRIYASNRKIEIASFNPKTKIEVGAFLDASVPESDAVTLMFPASSFYDLCEMIVKRNPDNTIVRLSMGAKDKAVSILAGATSYNLPILNEKK